jgi:hypothetical protein
LVQRKQIIVAGESIMLVGVLAERGREATQQEGNAPISFGRYFFMGAISTMLTNSITVANRFPEACRGERCEIRVANW